MTPKSDIGPENLPDPGECWIWDALVSDSDLGVCIVEDDGMLLYVNESIAKLYVDVPAEQAVGKKLQDLFPEPIYDEMISIMRGPGLEHDQVVRRSIWRGKQLSATYRRISEEGESPTRYLVTARHVKGEIAPSGEAGQVIRSRYADFGPLNVLSAREIEVLALLGQGLRINDIARLLHRSAKTIEGHRLAIGRKLGESDRIELARIAEQAGLTVDDAALRRIKSQGN